MRVKETDLDANFRPSASCDRSTNKRTFEKHDFQPADKRPDYRLEHVWANSQVFSLSPKFCPMIVISLII